LGKYIKVSSIDTPTGTWKVQLMTMIDPMIIWIEIVDQPMKKARECSQIFDEMWLC